MHSVVASEARRERWIGREGWGESGRDWTRSSPRPAVGWDKTRVGKALSCQGGAASGGLCLTGRGTEQWRRPTQGAEAVSD